MAPPALPFEICEPLRELLDSENIVAYSLGILGIIAFIFLLWRFLLSGRAKVTYHEPHFDHQYSDGEFWNYGSGGGDYFESAKFTGDYFYDARDWGGSSPYDTYEPPRHQSYQGDWSHTGNQHGWGKKGYSRESRDAGHHQFEAGQHQQRRGHYHPSHGSGSRRRHLDGSLNYFDVLGLPATAGKAAVKKKYHQLAKKWHPDRCKQKKEVCEGQMMAITRAYRVLSNDKLRIAYIRNGFSGAPDEDEYGWTKPAT